MKKVLVYMAGVGGLILAACQGNVFTGSIEITSIPTGAQVFVDDSLTEMTTDCTLEDIEVGNRVIRLTYEYYVDWIDTVNVEKDLITQVDAVLEKGFAGLAVTSQPEGASVYISGIDMSAVTNCTLFITNPGFFGDINVDLILTDYKDWQEMVKIVPGETTYVDAVMEPDSILWKYTIESGIWSPPSLGHDGTIYFTSYDSTLHAVNPDGTSKWTFKLGGLGSTPVIEDDGTIYILANDSKLYAVSSGGSLIWTYQMPPFIQHMPVSLGQDGSIYCAKPPYEVYAIDKNGDLLWSVDTCNGPVSVDRDGTIYCSSGGYSLTALTPEGEVLWQNVLGLAGFQSIPVIADDGTIYLNSDKNIYSFDSENGDILWTYTTQDFTSSIAVDANGILYFSNRRAFYAVNPDGSLRWEITLPITSYPGGCPSIGADGTIFFTQAQEAKLYAINPDGTIKWEMTEDDFTLCSPLIRNDGVIYIGGNSLGSNSLNTLYAVKSDCGGLASTPWPTYQHDNQRTGRVD